MKPRAFTSEEERFLIAQLNQADDRIATKALQWLCERCRAGYFFADPTSVRATIRLCLHRTHPNARRWAVNALTEIGPGRDVSPILALLASTENDPDLLAAIVAAIFSSKSEDEAIELLGGRNVHMEGLALIAASQFSFNQKRALVEQLVPLETADEASLRSAIVLAGTKKAPEHLFHRYHPNAIALSELNLHDCASVSKYSIWALAQLEHGFSSLVLPEDRIESSPDEIRKWVFRLLISDPPALVKRLDMFEIIQNDPSQEVREESAIELRDSFAPGIDEIVSHWFFREAHAEARALLLDHMAAQSEMSPRYPPIVIEMYKKSPAKSASRERLEAAAAKTPLFRELRRIAITEEHGLLFANDNELSGGGGNVTNINIHGGHIGAITGAGDIRGETIAAIAQVQNADTKAILAEVFEVLALLTDENQKRNAELLLQDAAKQPDKSKWRKILALLKGAKDGTIALTAAVGGIDQLIHKISDLAS